MNPITNLFIKLREKRDVKKSELLKDVTTLVTRKTKYLFWYYYYKRLADIQRIWTKSTKRIRVGIRVLLIIVSIILSICIYFNLNIKAIEPQSVSGWYVSIGGMLGGILAIVFSLINFLQQSSEDLQSSIFYQKYIHSWREKLIYSFVALSTLAFIFIGLIFTQKVEFGEKAKIIICLSTIDITLVVVLIDYLHELTSNKVNPLNAVLYLRKQSIKILDSINKDSKKIIKLIKLSTSNTPQYPHETLVFSSIQKQRFNRFSEHVVDLIEITELLQQKNKISAVNRSIECIQTITSYYLSLRHENSAIRISGADNLFSFESDSQQFMTNLLEGIYRFSLKLFRTGQENHLIKVIELYEKLSIETQDFTYYPKVLLDSNPINEQIIFYFNIFIDEAIKLSLLNVIFQSTKALRNISMETVKHQNNTSLIFLLDQLEKNIVWGFKNNQPIIVDRCIESYADILYNLVSLKNTNIKSQVSKVLEYIFKYTNLSQTPSIQQTFYLISLHTFINGLNLRIEALFALPLRDANIKHNLLTLLQELYVQLKKYSSIYQDTAGILDLIGKFIHRINLFLIIWIHEESDLKTKEELKNLIERFAHSPNWFINEQTKIKPEDFTSLIQSTTFVGIEAIKRLKDDHLIEVIFNSLKSITNKFIAKDNVFSGFEEPRIALYLCIFGTVLLKENQSKMFKDLQKYIINFDTQYKEKYKDISINSDISSILKEFWDLRDNFSRYSQSTHDILPIVIKEMSITDIDMFIFRMWGICDDQCSLKNGHNAI
jgi:hypothetical protein